MNKRIAIALSVAFLATAGIASSASAQEKTRAEVRQELIQAENNGLRFVTDTSYPEVNPIFEKQVARLKQKSESGFGADMKGASAAGKAGVAAAGAGASSCVGPAAYCTPYFGS